MACWQTCRSNISLLVLMLAAQFHAGTTCWQIVGYLCVDFNHFQYFWIKSKSHLQPAIGILNFISCTYILKDTSWIWITQNLLILTNQFLSSTYFQVILLSFMHVVKPHVALHLINVMSLQNWALLVRFTILHELYIVWLIWIIIP